MAAEIGVAKDAEMGWTACPPATQPTWDAVGEEKRAPFTLAEIPPAVVASNEWGAEPMERASISCTELCGQKRNFCPPCGCEAPVSWRDFTP